MSKRIASLFAEIGADTKGFEEGAKRTKASLKEQQDMMKSFAAVQKQKAKEFEEAEKQKEKAAKEAAKAQEQAYKEAEKQQKSYEKSLRDAAKTEEDTRQRMIKGVKEYTIALAAVGVAVKQAYDLAEMGATNERLIQSGKMLAAQYNESFDEIIDKVGEASLNTVDKMSLVSAANRAMMLNVTTDADEMANLMEVAAFRARAMGISTTQAFNDIVTGIGRNSPMILDNLGIITKGWAEEAKATGVAYDQHFILNKVLEQGNEQMRIQGGLVEDTATKYEQFNAEMSNFKADAGTFFMNVMTPALMEMNQNIKESGFGLGVLRFGFDDLFRAMRGTTRASQELSQEEIYLNELAEAGARADAEWAKVIEMKVAGFYKVREVSQDLQMDYGQQISLIKSIQSADESYSEKSLELAEERKEVQAELHKLNQQGYSIEGQTMQEQLEKLDEIEKKEAELAEERAKQTYQFISNILAENLARDGWTENEFNAFAEQQVAWGLWSEDVMQKSKDAWTAAAEITAAIESIPDAKIVDIKLLASPVQIGGGFGNSGMQSYRGGEKQYANGGSFVIPASYGNEGFNMGGMASASGGETVTVTPAGGGGAIDYAKMARTIVQAMQSAG